MNSEIEYKCKPDFSIVLPVYNSEVYLDEAICSVRDQIGNWEIIIIDDASTDSSRLILDKYSKDVRIRLYRFDYNQGPGISRNFGIQKAKGEYIIFLDADDYFAENAFEQLLNAIEKKTRTEVFIWGYSLFQARKKKRKVFLPQKPDKAKGENPFQLGMLSRKGFSAVPWVYVVKRSLIEKHALRFSEGIYFEDIEFTTSLLYHAKKVRVLPFVGYHYRKHPLSVTGRSSKQKIDDKFTAFTQIKSFLEDQGVFQQFQSLYLARFLTFCVYTCFNDYFSLSKNERDQELNAYMHRIRRSTLLRKENLLLLRNIGLSLSMEKEKTTRTAYLRAYAGLLGIKNRYHLHRFLTRLFLRLNRLKT